MTTRKLIRRTILLAAITTTSSLASGEFRLFQQTSAADSETRSAGQSTAAGTRQSGTPGSSGWKKTTPKTELAVARPAPTVISGQRPAAEKPTAVAKPKTMLPTTAIRPAVVGKTIVSGEAAPLSSPRVSHLRPVPVPSGIQQVQFRPAPAAPPAAPPAVPQQVPAQNNTAVVSELNRLFQENGQEMPSMRAQDLPNGNVHRVSPPVQRTTASAPPSKPSFFERFTNRLRGNSGDKSAEQSSTGSGQAGKASLSNLSAPPPNRSADLAPQLNAGVPNVPGSYNNSAMRPAGISHPAASQFNQPNGQMVTPPGAVGSRFPYQSAPANAAPTQYPAGRPYAVGQVPGAYNAPGGFQNQSGYVQGVPQQPRSQGFVQPGAAPAFMQSTVQQSTGQSPTGGPASQTASNVATNVSQPKQRGEPALVGPASDDDFVDPFEYSGVTPAADEVLDLDSLLEAPKSRNVETVQVVESPAPQSVAAAASPGNQTGHSRIDETEQSAEVSGRARLTESASTATSVWSAAGPTADAKSASDSQPEVLTVTEVQSSDPSTIVVRREPVSASSDSSAAKTDTEAESAAAEPIENPFTGVRLDMSDEEFFDEGVGRATLEPAKDDVTIGNVVPPVSDFGSNLPGLDLSSDASAAVIKPAATVSTPATTVIEPARTVEPAARSASAASQTPVPTIQEMRARQTAERNDREHQQRLIAARAGQTGFKGFCPVELRDSRDLVEADPKITAKFGLQTYRFSSAKARAAFESDPSRYAPAAGGSDVVLLVNTGEEQPGMLDYTLWYRDRLYMFRSRESMAAFSQNPSKFANQY